MSENTNEGLGGIASLLQNPEIASKLPRIMEAMAPVIAEMRAEESNAPSDEKAEVPPSAENALAAILGGGKKNESRSKRYALLHALEPYLSDSRRETMGYILKVASLLDVLGEVL